MGARIRLDTKPGKSLTSTGVLPRVRDSSITAFVVASSVRSPRMTSTSFITGTGFMKCIPITCPGRPVRAAIAVIEMDEVLEARIAWSGASRSSSEKISYLSPAISGTASMTNPAPFTGSREADGAMRPSAPARPSSVITPLASWRSRLRPIVATPRSIAPESASMSATRRPPSAHTCAIPFPMVPAPTTATRSMLMPPPPRSCGTPPCGSPIEWPGQARQSRRHRLRARTHPR